jgi:2-oxoacid:acceptor oxidoreductase delta subunit (pyruvate/2-ketoisovalerate family)
MTDKPSQPILFPIEGAAGKTGEWRTYYPKVDPDLCIKCNICWKFCPDNAIFPADREKDIPIKHDYDYCKGCGICAEECPKDAISMIPEGD